MEKVIYENASSKMVAKLTGDILELTQTLDGEVIGSISMYDTELKELIDFVNENSTDNLDC